MEQLNLSSLIEKEAKNKESNAIQSIVEEQTNIVYFTSNRILAY